MPRCASTEVKCAAFHLGTGVTGAKINACTDGIMLNTVTNPSCDVECAPGFFGDAMTVACDSLSDGDVARSSISCQGNCLDHHHPRWEFCHSLACVNCVQAFGQTATLLAAPVIFLPTDPTSLASRATADCFTCNTGYHVLGDHPSCVNGSFTAGSVTCEGAVQICHPGTIEHAPLTCTHMIGHYRSC